jgi:hypothetical protein
MKTELFRLASILPISLFVRCWRPRVLVNVDVESPPWLPSINVGGAQNGTRLVADPSCAKRLVQCGIRGNYY